MTTATSVSKEQLQVPSLSQAVCGLLSTLSAGDADGRLNVSARSRHGFGERSLFLPVDSNRQWIDAPILELLEDDSWALRVGVAVLHPSSSQVVRLGALSAHWRIPTVYKNPEDPKSEFGKQHIADEERAGVVFQNLEAFALPATMLINYAAHEVHALWRLADPIELQSRTDVDQVQELRRSLARALEADVPGGDDDLGAVTIPVVGSIVREAPYIDVVTCLSLDMDRVYSVEQISAASRKDKS